MASVCLEVSVGRHACLTFSKQLLHPPFTRNARRISVTVEQKNKRELYGHTHVTSTSSLSLCVCLRDCYHGKVDEWSGSLCRIPQCLLHAAVAC